MSGAAQWALAIGMVTGVFAALTVLQLTAVDGVLHALATRTPLRGFFRWSYTKNFGRYRAPGFQPGETGA